MITSTMEWLDSLGMGQNGVQCQTLVFSYIDANLASSETRNYMYYLFLLEKLNNLQNKSALQKQTNEKIDMETTHRMDCTSKDWWQHASHVAWRQ